MGNIASIPPNHIRIYKNLLAIQSVPTRIEMIDTLLASPECVQSMKIAGIYGHILHYKTALRTGVKGVKLPGEGTAAGMVDDVRRIPNTGESRIVVHSGNQIVRAGGFTEVDQKGNEHAISYFTRCLRVLGLEDEVALTEEVLKKAYKMAGKAAHPDKGGSEAKFEAVTRAYAYLMDILIRIKGVGGKSKGGSDVKKAIPALTGSSNNSSSQAVKRGGMEKEVFQSLQPVTLNPKNLDMKAFNDLFEKTKLRDSSDDGYGDWLKEESSEKGVKKDARLFSGEFNRSVFNSVFENNVGNSVHEKRTEVQSLNLAPMMGTEIGMESFQDFTAPANSDILYTDLRAAYTKENTFSQQVAGAYVQDRSLADIEAERKKETVPYTKEELEEYTMKEKNAIDEREKRRKEQLESELQYYDRLKNYVKIRE